MQFADSLVFHIFHRVRADLWAGLWKMAWRLRSRQRAARVDAGGVPEQEALRVEVAGRLDLRPDVVEGVLAPQREVLEPGDEHGVPAAELPAEVPERAGDRDARNRVRIVQAVLAGPEVGWIDHRVDAVEVRSQSARSLADAHLARGAQSEDGGGDARAERLEPPASVFEEPRDRRAPVLPLAALEDGVREVAVGGEAHVVEHDLVEARPDGRLGDVQVVLPDALVVRIAPAEAGAGRPDVACGRMDREAGPPLGEEGILEDDDSSDQVEAALPDVAHHPARVVVVVRRADPLCQADGRTAEGDLAGLVLDVELDRVQTLARQVVVLLELAV